MLKRFAFILSAFLLVFSLAGCADAPEPQNKPEPESAEPELVTVYLPVKSVDKTHTGVFDYNEQGFLTGLTFKNPAGTVDSRWEFEYDENGKPVCEKHFPDQNSEANSICRFLYDDTGNLVRKTGESREEDSLEFNVTSATDYEYDTDHRVTKEARYNKDRALYQLIEWEYGPDAAFATTETEYKNGEIESVWVKEYQDEDTLLSSVKKDAHGTTISSTVYLYEYDTSGRIIKQTANDENGETKEIVESEYNEEGLLSKQSSKGSANNLLIKTEYLYDEHQNLIGRSLTYIQDEIVKSTNTVSYEYKEFRVTPAAAKLIEKIDLSRWVW